MASRKQLREAADALADENVTYARCLVRRGYLTFALVAASLWQSALFVLTYLKTL